MKVLSNLDLNRNQLLNAIVQVLGSAPSSPVAGLIYYDSTDGTLRFYNGTAFVITDAAKVADGYIPIAKLATNPLQRSNHLGTQTASTISDFDTQVRTSRLNQMAAPNASVSWNSQLLTNLADPVSGQDAATRSWTLTQVQASAAGLDVKLSCRAATTANITLSGAQTIDGVSIVAGDRVLVKNQTSAAENGIYVCAAGAWSRSTDCNTASNYTSGAFTFVEEGTANGATQWKVSTTGVFVIGTTAITWVQFGASNGYVAGNGISIAGNTISAAAGSGIVVDGSGINVDTSVVARKYSGNIGDGSTTSIVVTHNLGTRDVVVQLRNASSPYDSYLVDWDATSTNTITVHFATAPSSNSVRVTVIA